ncbi:troponin I, fast skeletal muscle-like [Engraulis encrasicolus]|uniref:troponin I, fast skeletal muscle-like n=1 Tax=Engraulis encrasicolus TaxID=184585 RepID=UPI002FCFA628
MSEKKMPSSRKYALKSLMLSIAQAKLNQEAEDKIQERKNYMEEHCPPLNLPYGVQELQELIKKIHGSIDKIDEERYDLAAKSLKGAGEVEDLRFKITDLKGMKKPALKKVRMSADQMLQALLGSKHKVNLDLRANLKQVKKEVKQETAEAVGDWRANIEEKKDRKKMFEGAEA